MCICMSLYTCKYWQISALMCVCLYDCALTNLARNVQRVSHSWHLSARLPQVTNTRTRDVCMCAHGSPTTNWRCRSADPVRLNTAYQPYSWVFEFFFFFFKLISVSFNSLCCASGLRNTRKSIYKANEYTTNIQIKQKPKAICARIIRLCIR